MCSPDLSGIVVQQEIAAQAVTRDIPVVVITGSALEPEILDVACFLRKPISPDQLVDAVRKCLASGTRAI